MQIKFVSTLIDAKEEASKILAIAWSPNNMKLAVCNYDRIVLLYDENGERKDKFPTKPANSKNGRKSYSVKGLAFSPDSTKIAVGQTDNIIYVYKLGEAWGDKKVICNKFSLQFPTTCLTWLLQGPIIYGQVDGKVRAAHVKSNKSQTLYATGSFVVSLANNGRGTGFLSGHADGSIVRYYVQEDSTMEQQGRIATHSVAPYALAWPSGYFFAGGSDQTVCVYEKDGRLCKKFDYSEVAAGEKEFSAAISSPSGQAVIFGSYDRLRLYAWNSGKGCWEEGPSKEIKNLYTVTALAWRRDGSRVACGSLCGCVHLFESVLKKMIWRNKFEITYVSPSQVLVKSTTDKMRQCSMKSKEGCEINDVQIMGDDTYAVARTSSSLIISDLRPGGNWSEVPRPNSDGGEKFYFENASVCLIFNAGELTLVEYGKDEPLVCVRTEFTNPHLISVRLNERKRANSSEDNKKLAYLLDLRTICLVDLVLRAPIMQATHDSKIDWLELNETGHKLLFRDKKMNLTLLDVRTSRSYRILTSCTFVQWVPGSDVVVAQAENNACVWYNIDTPDRISIFPVKGEIMDVARSNGKTEILTQEGSHQFGYELDEGLVEFGTAVHDSDFARAITFLENFQRGVSSESAEVEGMWQNLAEITLRLGNLKVAERCYAALGDAAKTHFLRVTSDMAEEYAKAHGGDGSDCPDLLARMAILNDELETAETIYLEHDQLDKAVEMYKNYHKWEEALRLAETNNYPRLEELSAEYADWLKQTGQEEKAAELKGKKGDYRGALNAYLAADLPTHASWLVQRTQELLDDETAVDKVLTALLRSERYRQAGELYEYVDRGERALDCYRKGGIYSKAVELAKRISPKDVVTLEEEWGDHLMESKQQNAAINHYIEAGKTAKALEAAMEARQWKKAVQIIEVIDDISLISENLGQLGKYFANSKDYKMAERLYARCEMYKEAVEMFAEAGDWKKAYFWCQKCGEEGTNTLVAKGKYLEKSGKLAEAEKLYTIMEQPDLAITMYKTNRQFDQMMKLVKAHHSDLVETTYLHLAQNFESENDYKNGEKYYVLGGEWKLAVKMYRSADMWEDAYRVAKGNGGEQAAEQVAFLWAKSLGGDLGAKLLTKLNLLEGCIEHACDSYQFDFAFDLARIAAKEKLPKIHYKHAMVLEDEGEFEKAEEQFIKAGKAKEAVLMYVHNKDWTNAERVAEIYDDSCMPEILQEQAKEEFQLKNYARFESLLLRAQKPEFIISAYKESEMWLEAMRVCKEYLPGHLEALQSEYQKAAGSSKVSRDINSLMVQARQWEQNGEFPKAVDCYVKVVETNSMGSELAMKALKEGTRLIIKYLRSNQYVKFAKIIGAKLMECREIKAAAQVYAAVEMTKEAVDAFILDEDWGSARKMAAEFDVGFEKYIVDRYRESLRKSGRMEELANADAVGALDLLASQGNFAECLEMAKPYGEQILHKYVALYATEFIKKGNPLEAADLYGKYGTPAFPQNYNIYRRIVTDVLASENSSRTLHYSHLAKLRNIISKLVEVLKTNATEAENTLEFETLLLVCHYYATRCAFRNAPELTGAAAKISISLLRYSDQILPADKAYFEAGMDAKVQGWNSEAFVFLNHFLDLNEAIDEGNADLIDHSDLEYTDFPGEISLPEKLHVDEVETEKVREWVLTKSMDRNIDQVLPRDERNLYPANLSRGGEGEAYPACILTGWPVKSHGYDAVEFSKGKAANKEDWNRLNNLQKTPQISDLLEFIREWCGAIKK